MYVPQISRNLMWKDTDNLSWKIFLCWRGLCKEVGGLNSNPPISIGSGKITNINPQVLAYIPIAEISVWFIRVNLMKINYFVWISHILLQPIFTSLGIFSLILSSEE